jgi:hypothetical protein
MITIEILTLRLSVSVSPTSVHLAINRSPARGAIGSKIIPSLSRISKRGFVLALTDVTKSRKVSVLIKKFSDESSVSKNDYI